MNLPKLLRRLRVMAGSRDEAGVLDTLAMLNANDGWANDVDDFISHMSGDEEDFVRDLINEDTPPDDRPGRDYIVGTLGAAPVAVSNPMAGVTRDATSLIYCPANAAEWTTTMAAAGIASGNPNSVWNCQEASGNLADAMAAGITLTQSGAGHLYQQPVAGWSRLAVTTIDGTAGQRWLNSTTAPNPNTTDTLLLAYVRLPAAAPAAVRSVMAVAAAGDVRYNTTQKVRVGYGASADLVNVSNGVHVIVSKVDNTNSASVCYTDQEKFVGTYALPASAALIEFGSGTTVAGDNGFLYVVEFAGAAARLTDANVKSLLQTLGWTIPWT